jgi:hypothetical protein
MGYKLDNIKSWKCQECGEQINQEEAAQIVEMLQRRGSVEFHCDHCNDEITADTDFVPEGEVELNPSWAY